MGEQLQLDYKELLKHELISLRETLIVMDTALPYTRAGHLAEKISVCLDYLLYLEDTSLPKEAT